MNRTRFVAVVLSVGLVVGGCSGSSNSSSNSNSNSNATTSSSNTSSSATSTTAARNDDSEAQSAASSGCGIEADVARVDPNQRPGDVTQDIDIDGQSRHYRLGVPESYDPTKPAPLVLNLHGSGSNALEASAYGDVARRAAQRGMITVAPESIGGLWQLGANGSDDDFLNQLVDDIESRYCIDLDRVHMVGMSLGAWKTAVTACAAGDRFASLSLVTVEVFPGECEPTSVVAFHGRADRTVPYGRGATVSPEGSPNEGLPATLDSMDLWAKNAGCDLDPEVSRIGEDVELRRFSGCDDGFGVELYTIDEGGHTWPGSDLELGPTTQTIDASEITLDWFEAHPRR